jgi:glycosyltransferase involved in cell wall biosynthesis
MNPAPPSSPADGAATGLTWLNVTTIHHWQRPAVGIVRVESECAAHALAQGDPQVRFCRFDSGAHTFVQVSRDDVGQSLRRIQGAQFKAPPDPASSAAHSADSAPAAGREAWEARITRALMKALERLPPASRMRAFNFASRRVVAYRAFAGGLLSLWAGAKLFFNPPVPVNPVPSMMMASAIPISVGVAPFGPHDTYVSLGLDWDQRDAIHLFEQKRQIGFRVLLFCYDIIPVKLPHLCVGDVAARFGMYFANMAWSADLILCISECSRTDLRELLTTLGAPIPRLETVRLGSGLPESHGEEPSAEVLELLGRRFLLFVSTIERRKNHETLYRAYTRLIDAGYTDLPTLVFVGMQGWGVQDFLADVRLDPRVRPYIRILNHASDADLVSLYRGALFTVYPSLYEGWGLPVAESLAYGKFCLASNAASIPEVAGELIEYVDPWNVQAWADRIRHYLENPQLLRDAEQRIAQQHRPARWDDCAASVFSAARQLREPPQTIDLGPPSQALTQA